MALDNDFTSCSLKFYEALTSGNGLQGIVDVAAELFDNPVLVADTSFKVLAHVEKPDIDNELWLDIINKGLYPASYVYSIRGNDDLYGQVFSSSASEIVSDGVSPNRFLSKMITVGNKPIGFATCIENDRELTGQDAQLFDVFCKVIGTELRSNKLFLQNRSRRYNYFISEIIGGPVKADFLEERLRNVGLQAKKYNFILATEFSDEKMRHEHQIEFFCNALEQTIPGSHCTVYHNSIVALICRDNPDILTGRFITDVNNQLEITNMIGGISHRYLNIADTNIHYRQAKEAIRIGKRLGTGGRLLDYAKMSFLHMAEIVGGTEELRTFCNPELLDIIEYDSQYNTKYAQTIHAYLYYDRNPSLIAKRLDVHRNTVDYRIKKTEELFGIDLSKQDTLFCFDLSFRILEYLRELPY